MEPAEIVWWIVFCVILFHGLVIEIPGPSRRR